MSESSKIIIKYFCDRFLDIDYYPTSLKTVLDLELSFLKGITDDQLKKFLKLDITTLRDLSGVNGEDYEKQAKKVNLDLSTFKNAIIAAYLVANSWNKRKLYMKKPKMKVVIAGLDYAGKTSLMNRLINDYNYNDMINLEPTIGANVEEYQSERLDLVLWDLGGQKDHINEYLASPERFFVHVDVMIFVFDSQDDIRYDEALKYLRDLIDIFGFLNELPYIEILLNKADSDVVKDPDFQIKLEYLTDKISKVFMESEKSWNFEMIPTSIYNYYSTEPEIAKSIKSIFSKEKDVLDTGTLLPDINEKLQKILDINLKLMDKVVVELSEVKRVLHQITPSDVSQTLFSIPFEKVPIDFISTNDIKEEQSKLKKKKKKDSAIDMKKVKQKKSYGPPKRLKELPKPTEEVVKLKESEKITIDKIKEAKAQLTSEITDNIESKRPPMAPKVNQITLNMLKPPLPPPKLTSNSEVGQENVRTQVISELKEMFVKRGLVSR
jgi:GTPase SAR1 family protein